jgi:hypothetical protein
MTDTIIGAIIGVGGAIIGAILAGPVTYYFSKVLIKMTHKNAIELMRRQEFNKAAADFKAAFIPGLRYLDYRYSPERPPEIGIYKTLSSAFDRHEIAIIKFRPYLCGQQQIWFDKAWDDYCDKKEDSKPHFMVYAEPNGVIEKIKAQKNYLEKLNALLKFSEPKH